LVLAAYWQNLDIPMSSTEIPKRTEFSWILDPAKVSKTRNIAAGLVLTILLVSFRPFQPGGSLNSSEGGDMLNQLGFGAVGAASLLMMLSYVDRKVLTALLSPWWIITLLFVLLSVQHSLNPAGAFRAVAFMMMGLFGVLAILSLSTGAEGFAKVLLVAGGAVLALSFIGVVLLPDVAKHTVFSEEPEHAGLWRGIYSHKNIAGPVMAGISFIGLYLFRRGKHFPGLLLALGGLIFLANTGSKTSALLAPMVVVLVAGPGLFGARALASVGVFVTICMFALATVGSVLFKPLHDLRESIAPGSNFTGRTELWKFAFQNLADRPWTGFGFESFWFTPFVRNGEKSLELEWDIRGAVHGHNGYVDIALTMGIPALAAALLAMIVMPLIDYARVPKTRENVLMADLFLMIFTFSALNAFLESFFFRRADPVWLLFVLAVFGLRLVARFDVSK
jgi:O-antigen ligase